MSWAKVIANLRVDEALKEQAWEIAQQMWLSLSTVMTLLLKKFVLEKKIEVSLDENGFTPKKKQMMLAAIQETKHHGKKVNSIKELLAD